MSVDQPDIHHIVKPWQPSPQREYVFTSANLVDPVTGKVSKNTTINLSGGFVSSVDTTGVKVGDGTDTNTKTDVQMDMKGKYICPGLIDWIVGSRRCETAEMRLLH